MKYKILTIVLLVLLSAASEAQHPAIGGYNVYYGDLHNHSAVSDGEGTQADAYNYAKNTAHLDFFGLTDHSEFFTQTTWDSEHTQADAYNEDGVFVALAGFEWTSDIYGHLTVLNTPDYCVPELTTATFPDLLVWLAERPDGVAFFNHPGYYNSSGLEFSHFDTTPSKQIVGIELWNYIDGFNMFYYVRGYYSGDNEKSFIDEANNRGWNLGALGSGDDHTFTWGTLVPYRTGLLANSLTRDDVLDALRARRFFSTLDKNIALSFQINGIEMGSTVTAGNDTVRIRATDGDLENFTRVILYNSDHDAINTWNINTNSVDIKVPLVTANGTYYYVKITEADDDEAISSPIWIGSGTSNQRPLCAITSPAQNSSSPSPATIIINADAVDPDGTIEEVEFFQGSHRLGEDETSPYSFTWENVPIGTYSLTVKARDNSHAESTSPAITFTVTGTPVTVTADAKTKTYGDPDPVLTYHITSGSLQGSDVFSGSLSRIPGEDAGTWEITQGTLSLDSKYTITFVPADLTINQKPVTVTAANKTKVYGNPDPLLTYELSAGLLIGNDSFSGSLSRNTGENVGVYPINQGSLTLGPNYAITFTGANMAITTRDVSVSANNVSRLYGDADNLTYRITAGSLASGDNFTGSLSRAPGENVGTYPVSQGTLALNSNYAVTFTGATLTIAMRPVTVSANNISKYYGDPEVLGYRITSGSLAAGDNFTGSVSRESGESTGSYQIIQGTLALTSNYDLKFNNANLTIAARPVAVAANNISKIYGDADNLTWHIVSGSLAGSDNFSGTISRDPGENVGVYSIKQGTLDLGTNYVLSFNQGVLEITPRPVSVTADDKSRIYGATDPELTYRITAGSLAGSDQFTGSITRDPGENFGTYNITLGTLDAGSNYSLHFTGALFTIFKNEITIEADPQSKIYGDPDPQLSYRIISGTLANDDEIQGELLRESGEDPGNYAITIGSLNISDDYALNFTGAGFVIEKRPITLSADNLQKVLGEADPELTYTITSGSLAGNDEITGQPERDTGENVGSYVIKQGTISTGNQYELTFVDGVFKIVGINDVIAYPNPFTDHAFFEFSINKTSMVTIEIFNQSGIKVATVCTGKLIAGSYRFIYTPAGLPCGIYTYKTRINDYSISGKLVHIR